MSDATARGQPLDDVEYSDDALVVTFRPRGQRKRRFVFEPLTHGLAGDGPAQYQREEWVLEADGWRSVGVEHVDSVTVRDGRDA